MRIVQLANFHSPTSGGLRVAVDTLRAGYLAAGHACTLIAPGALDATVGSIHTLRSPKLPNGSGYRVILRRKAVLSLLDELRPDVVEAHDKLLQHWLWPWSRARQVPVVALSHERLARTLPMLVPGAPKWLLNAVGAAVARRTAVRCDELIACSRFAAAEFAPYAPVRIVPLGVDLATFHPAKAHEPGPLRLVLASRLSPEKRPDLAIDAVRVLHARGVPLELTVLGDGPLRTAIGERARGLPVRFAGYLPSRSEVAAALRRADLAIAPAPAETFGLAALESLASGVAVVAHQGSAAAELVDGAPAAGRAAPPDPARFADAVCALAALPAAERSAAARRQAESYPWSATVAAMLDVHLSVTGTAPRPPVYVAGSERVRRAPRRVR